jgi:hypothetical protein
MAEERPRKGARPVLLVAILLAVIIFAIIVFVVLGKDGGEAEDGTPPELGPDTAQTATPGRGQSASNDSGVQPAQVANPPAAIEDFVFEDETLTFKVRMPDGPSTDPMRRWLTADARGVLSARKPNARADHERLKRNGVIPPKWDISIDWDYTAKAEEIVSLFGVMHEYTGGAHPVQHFDTIIANPETGKRITMADMLVLDRSPSPAMMIAICEALKTAKMKRIKSATIMDEPIVCAGAGANARTEDAKIALAPSNKPGRFGGIYAYYEPYAVGPYAEGAYRLTIQQEIFAQDLKSDYRKLFDGEAPVLAEDRLSASP